MVENLFSLEKRDEMKFGKSVEDPGSETPSTDEEKPGRGFRRVFFILFDKFTFALL